MRMSGCTRCGTPIPERLCKCSEAVLLGVGQWSRRVAIAVRQPVSAMQQSRRIDAGSEALLPLASVDCDEIANHGRPRSRVVQGDNHSQPGTSISEDELDLPPSSEWLLSQRG